MYGLDLFSGIGGLTRALDGYVRPVAYCENNERARTILCRRMGNRDIPSAPIWDDVRTLSGYRLPHIDIIYAGFPCQDISASGIGKGLDGERSGLFTEIIRLAKETKAEWIFLENVPAIRTRGLGRVVKSLANIGYDCRWGVLSASSVGSPIKAGVRRFLLAKATSKGLQGVQYPQHYLAKPIETPWLKWETEPNVARVANGVPNRVDRTIALGNAVIPQQARYAFEVLSGLRSQ